MPHWIPRRTTPPRRTTIPSPTTARCPSRRQRGHPARCPRLPGRRPLLPAVSVTRWPRRSCLQMKASTPPRTMATSRVARRSAPTTLRLHDPIIIITRRPLHRHCHPAPHPRIYLLTLHPRQSSQSSTLIRVLHTRPQYHARHRRTRHDRQSPPPCQ